MVQVNSRCSCAASFNKRTRNSGPCWRSKGKTGFVPHRLRDGGVAGLGGQRLKVVFFNDDGRWLHHLHHVVTLGLEYSTQGLVTLQYLLERALYRRGVQRPFSTTALGRL
jgi:hypothetical protein